MPETTTTVATAANKAADRAVKAAAAAAETLPTVVETAEVAFEMPSKVVLNQRLVVVASVLGGTALGVGGLLAFNKIKKIRHDKKLRAEVDEILDKDDETKTA